MSYQETGEKEETFKNVPLLKQGAMVLLSRNDVDMAVTEYGIANLRGKSVKKEFYVSSKSTILTLEKKF